MLIPSTVPECTITYPKDLSKLILSFDPLGFYEISATSVTTSFLVELFLNNTDKIMFTETEFVATVLPTASTGSIINSAPTALTGSGTLFLTELQAGDIVIILDGANKYLLTIVSVESNTEATFKTPIDISLSSMSTWSILRPTIEFLSTELLEGPSILPDGNYLAKITTVSNAGVTNSHTFSKYVFANQYSCVETKMMNLALHCSEGCVDMDTLKNTLMLRGLLDALEISVDESALTSVEIIRNKIDRYCLLLNNNCTTC